MISKKLAKHLEDHGAKHELVEHKKVYTAYDASATMKVKLKEIAKSLLVKFNKPFITGEKPYALVIVPADKNIDLNKLKKGVSNWAVKLNKELRMQIPEKGKKIKLDIYNKITKVTIPKEKELKDKLKIKPGLMAAFGKMYKLPVFIDKEFLKNKHGIFAGDSFTQSIKMLSRDFQKLEEAFEINFSAPKKNKKPTLKKNKEKTRVKKVAKKSPVKPKKKKK